MTNGYKKHGGKGKGGHKQGQGTVGLNEDYLKEGYFSSDGHIREELLTTDAQHVARNFGRGFPKLTTGQLKRFYSHAKAAEQGYRFYKDEHKLVLAIKSLDSFVAEAQGKGKVPKIFYNFIRKNTDSINDSKDVLKGFLPHFQAVVAYFTYYHPNN